MKHRSGDTTFGHPPNLTIEAGRRMGTVSFLTNMATWPYLQAIMQLRPKDSSVFSDQARVLKALANESRLMIVDRLSRGDCSAGDLTRLIGSDQTTVSKHLALLRAHGIVDSRREGKTVIYRLLTPCVVNFFSCAAQVVKESR